MSKLRFTFTYLAIAACCGLSTASAQQPSPVQLQTEKGRPNTQQDGARTDQADRNQVSRKSDRAMEQEPTVKEAILKKLQKANEAEIEIAQLANEKSDNQEVKQLAQMIVQDHQACVQKLQQASGAQAHGESDNRPTEQVPQGQQGKVQRSGEDLASGNASATVPSQLCRISEQACENSLKMTKEMLGKYEGQDFNMAFLGQQCVAHMTMLAELKAIESDGPTELRQFAQEASQKVEQHLNKTKDLAKKLEEDHKSDRS